MKNKTIHAMIWIISALCIFVAGTRSFDRVYAQETDVCWLTPEYDTALFAAPVFTVMQQSGVLQAGERYAVRGQSPDYLWIQVDVETRGYVKRDQGRLSGTCAMNIPTISAPLSAHPTLCVLTTPAQPMPLFVDAALQVSTEQTLLANASYAVVQRSGSSYYVYLNEVQGGWVAAATGTVSGACGTLPDESLVSVGTAVASPDARLWSVPNVNQGLVLVTMTSGSQVMVLSGPVQGPISFSSPIEGDWYLVRWGALTGWVWSERLGIITNPPVPIGFALAQENTRLWSAPNVNQGLVLATLAPNSSVTILSGPVLGSISFSSSLEGDWYQVRWGTLTGWVWSERLIIIPQSS